MSDTVIRVENLGKKYVIGRSQEKQQYTALRDVIANGAKGLGNRFRGAKGRKDDSASEDFWALKDVSFEIKQGDRVGIIGRNGAGKSTLLKILSRITEPTKGRISINGRVASLLEVGTGFHPELTGRENVFLNGAILGMRKDEIRRKFDEIVEFAEVEKFLDTPVKHYSSGMYVRLAFAVAAHMEPEILIVDEVLAVGDSSFQKKCLGKMEDVAETEGRTVLFVSHNMAAITQLCSKAIYFEKGLIVENNSVDKVVAKYFNSSAEGNSHVVLLKDEDNRNCSALFTSLTIINSDEVETTDLDVRYSFYLQLRYRVFESIKNIEVTIRIDTDDGRPIFTSNLSDNNKYERFKCQDVIPGDYCSRVEIPGLFLMPENYLITVGLHQPMVEMYDLREHVACFSVVETGSNLSQYRSSKKLGMIMPSLSWSTKQASPTLVEPKVI